jgi:hypothetical protein
VHEKVAREYDTFIAEPLFAATNYSRLCEGVRRKVCDVEVFALCSATPYLKVLRVGRVSVAARRFVQVPARQVPGSDVTSSDVTSSDKVASGNKVGRTYIQTFSSPVGRQK